LGAGALVEGGEGLLGGGGQRRHRVDAAGRGGFEAAVRRAEQDSATPADPDTDRMTAVRENPRRPEGDGQ
ncbi:hypothetical protein, partial [Streptomyces neyagawaensis]